jgi:U6 snRNA-associated Sm-like protein LSm2
MDSIKVLDENRHPHMVRIASVCASRRPDIATLQMAVKNCFIRGSVVRYVQLPAEHVDTQLLEDATRRGTVSCLVYQADAHPSPEAMNQGKR